MGNAVPELKRAARIVAEDCAADGFACAIEEYVL
jgi:hydroxymethylpyrimidine pyrophosphatase-like HAD family hydrolase